MEPSLESLVKHVHNKPRVKLEVPRQIELYDLYITARFSTHTMARLYGTSNSIIIEWLSHYEISTRTKAESHLHQGSKRISKDELYQLYITEKKPLKDIAEMCHVRVETIYSWLNNYEIAKRKR